MESTQKIAKYPENLYLKALIKDSGITVKHLAKKIKTSTVVVSLTINGHYKGTRISELLLEQLKG